MIPSIIAARNAIRRPLAKSLMSSVNNFDFILYCLIIFIESLVVLVSCCLSRSLPRRMRGSVKIPQDSERSEQDSPRSGQDLKTSARRAQDLHFLHFYNKLASFTIGNAYRNFLLFIPLFADFNLIRSRLHALYLEVSFFGGFLYYLHVTFTPCSF